MKEEDGFVLSHVTVARTNNVTVERVCGEVNHMLNAWKRGYVAPLDFNDGAGARS